MSALTTPLHADEYGPPPVRVQRSRVEVVEYWTRLYTEADHLIERDPYDVIGPREEVAR